LRIKLTVFVLSHFNIIIEDIFFILRIELKCRKHVVSTEG